MAATLISHHMSGSVAPMSMHAAVAPVATWAIAYAAKPAGATFTDTTTVVNQWTGGGMCGNEGIESSNTGTSLGFATKRFSPGRLEGVT